MKFDDVRLKGFSKRIRLKNAIQDYVKTVKPFTSRKISVKNNPINRTILRENLFSKRTIPPFNRSAVDGYAIRAEDTYSASEFNPIILKIIDEVAVKEISKKSVEKGTAIQVSTGGVIPHGSTTVIMIENTALISEKNIEIYQSLSPGKNIAKAGEDFQNNSLIFKLGHQFHSVDRGFLLSAGVTDIEISSSPSISIISTGDELVEPWKKITSGQIPDINSVNLFDLCLNEGWTPQIVGIVKDQKILLRNIILESIKSFDVILISGGTSVGEKDYIPVLFDELGDVIFHGIAMRPGGPVIGATINEKAVFGVPGFPAAAIVAFQFVIKPIILSLMGLSQVKSPVTVPALISRNVGSKLGRLDFLRVKLKKSSTGGYEALPIQIGGSGILKNIIEANGIVPIPESSEGLKQGDRVDVILI